jgi:hypothetical protein
MWPIEKGRAVDPVPSSPFGADRGRFVLGREVMSNEAPAPKTRRRVASKTTSRVDEQKTKVTLYVSPDLAKRFAVHATYSDMDRSALFAEMIREHCKRFVVSDRAKVQDEPADANADR